MTMLAVAYSTSAINVVRPKYVVFDVEGGGLTQPLTDACIIRAQHLLALLHGERTQSQAAHALIRAAPSSPLTILLPCLVLLISGGFVHPAFQAR